MNQQKLYQWASELLKRLPCLSKWQAIGLAIFSIGVIEAESCVLDRVAEHLPTQVRLESVERRLRRWLANKHLDVAVCCGWWIRWVVSVWEGEWVLLVDETKLSNHLRVMMVGLAYGERCIPLVWWCYPKKGYPLGGQVALISALLDRVLPALPEGCRPVIQADRGLATSPALLHALNTRHLRFLVRVQKSVHLLTFGGREHVLRDLVKRGESWSGCGYVFKKQRQKAQGASLRLYVHVCWQWDQTDLWCLLTNDPTLAAEAYALRAWQEQAFRDLKSGGFQWQRSQVWTPAHADRLLLVLAIAYAWLLSLATLAPVPPGLAYARASRRSRPPRSLLRYALRFWRQLAATSTLFTQLFFAFDPRPERLCSLLY